jgi:Fe-S-cluster containining protein
MEYRDIERIFYRDGYRLAHRHLEKGVVAELMSAAIRELYQAVDGLLEAFIQRTAAEMKPAACRKGCSWCCHQAVFAVTHEFLFLQDFISENTSREERKEFYQKAGAKATLTREKSLNEQLLYKSPCPFLHHGVCRIYEARPMACRIYLSSSEAACKREYENPADEQQFPDLFDFPLKAGRMLNQGFVAYLKQSGLHVSEWPLEQGYTGMVSMGQTMAGWISGGPSSL